MPRIHLSDLTAVIIEENHKVSGLISCFLVEVLAFEVVHHPVIGLIMVVVLEVLGLVLIVFILGLRRLCHSELGKASAVFDQHVYDLIGTLINIIVIDNIYRTHDNKLNNKQADSCYQHKFSAKLLYQYSSPPCQPSGLLSAFLLQ